MGAVVGAHSPGADRGFSVTCRFSRLTVPGQVFFVITGLGKTLGNQQMAYIGIDVGWILLNAVISTIGPVIIPLWLRGVNGLRPTSRELRVAGVAAVLDAVGMTCSILGLKFAGSGLLSVIYASLPACTAVLRYFWMGKSISGTRVLFMLGVMAGLSVVPLNEGLHFHEGSGLLMVGLGMSFASTFVYGVLYVHVERSYAAEGLNASCDPLKLIFWQAVLACGLLLAGMVFWTAAIDSDVLLIKTGERRGMMELITFPTILLVASSASHAFSWTKLLEWQGSTGTGLLQAVRSSLSVLVSAMLFCEGHPSQCLSPLKVASAAVVTVFVLLFNRAK
jgi:hypothetical protein